MRKHIKALIEERDGIRGKVPSRHYGSQDSQYNAYLMGLNPREEPEIQMALAASKDIRFRTFLDRAMKYKRVSLASIAKACDIDLAEFYRWWNNESVQRAIAIAQTESVKITSDMATDARSVAVACERCDGMGWVVCPSELPPETPGYRKLRDDADGEEVWIRTCPSCYNGKTVRPGDDRSRDRVLQIAGLLKTGAGVTIQQNFNGQAHSSAIASLNDSMTIDIDAESSDV